MPRAGLRSSGKTTSVAAEMREHLKRLLAAGEVVLSAELAELLRHRELTWSLIPPLSRVLVMPFLTLEETLRLDTAVTERGDEKNPRDRDHLMKAYKGLRSAGFDEWVFEDMNRFEGVRWARKRDMDLQNLKLEYKGMTDRDTVLWILVEDGNEDMATYYAARSEARDAEIYGSTLMEASKRGYLEVVKCLLRRVAGANKANNLGETPLYCASRDGHLEVVQALQGAKAKVNKAAYGGFTPLHRASRHGNVELVQALLGANAEVNKVDRDGCTPLSMALKKNLPPVLHQVEAHMKNLRIATLLRGAGAHEPQASHWEFHTMDSGTLFYFDCKTSQIMFLKIFEEQSPTLSPHACPYFRKFGGRSCALLPSSPFSAKGFGLAFPSFLCLFVPFSTAKRIFYLGRESFGSPLTRILSV